MGKFTIDRNKIAHFLIILLMCITIKDLVISIKSELRTEKLETFNLIKHGNKKSVLELNTYSDLGWFNLEESSRDYEKGLDIVFICFQYMIAPTILENNGYNKKIICYYTSPEQLADFCNKKKNYKLIAKDIFDYFALFERKD